MSAIAAGRGRPRQFDPWPGYVDVLSTLLMVVIFVLMVFVIAQVFLSHALNQSDKELLEKNSALEKANEDITLKNTQISDLQNYIADLSAQLTGEQKKGDENQQRLTVILSERDSLAASLAGA